MFLAGQASAQNTTKPTLGTVQMPGDNGKLKTTYQIGQKGSEVHFVLESATVAARYPLADKNLTAGSKERLLVLTFTVQNPLKTEQRFSFSSLQFTAVSPDDKNFENRADIYDPVRKTPITQTLKPAQKVRACAVFPIYADGPVAKLIVKRGNSRVLRYDLTAGTTKMTSAFSKDGITLGDEAPGVVKTPVEFGALDVEVQEVVKVDSVGPFKPTSDQDMYAVTVKFTNSMLKEEFIGFQYYKPVLTDVNGETMDWGSRLVSPSSGKDIAQAIAPGEFVRGQYLFWAAKGSIPDRLKLTSTAGRTLIIKF